MGRLVVVVVALRVSALAGDLHDLRVFGVAQVTLLAAVVSRKDEERVHAVGLQVAIAVVAFPGLPGVAVVHDGQVLVHWDHL